ncbi:MAG TPA: hypothetical protein VFS00_27310, partial [Polyangiaceae bacterium]|nr:hypothetical protein [Polyangiaceae bacterium]
MTPSSLREPAPPPAAAAFQARGLVDEVRHFVGLHRASLAAALAEGGPEAGGVELGRQYARAIDGLLGALFAAACAASGRAPADAP